MTTEYLLQQLYTFTANMRAKQKLYFAEKTAAMKSVYLAESKKLEHQVDDLLGQIKNILPGKKDG